MMVDLDPKQATFNEFLSAAARTKTAPSGSNMRYGQLFFNLLDWLRPHLADELRGTVDDPFYREEVGPETLTWLEKVWED